ncbi:MAG: hypothetical protein J2P50_07255 [Hyphomicrobiaceae bacterium]|nr:hypothetical protein [Hyphomicrobiaceae bacterium]
MSRLARTICFVLALGALAAAAAHTASAAGIYAFLHLDGINGEPMDDWGE